MAWVTPPTFVSGNVLTAAQLNTLSGDLNETAPAKASSAGQIFVSTAANTIAARTVVQTTTSATETTATINTYGDLATVGPSVTVTTGPQALVFISCMSENASNGGGANMSFAVSGATTIAAPVGQPLRHMVESTAGTAAGREQWTKACFVTGLNAGSNVFTAKYTTPTGGTATFQAREMIVVPL